MEISQNSSLVMANSTGGVEAAGQRDATNQSWQKGIDSPRSRQRAGQSSKKIKNNSIFARLACLGNGHQVDRNDVVSDISRAPILQYPVP
jgi:hypothetical protein